MQEMVLGDFLAHGAFDATALSTGIVPRARVAAAADTSPAGLALLLGDLVRGRRNILIAGGTSSGKTTLLNALIKEIPADERLIFIEDTPELRFGHENAVGLVAVKGTLGEAAVTTDDLLQAALRMRPDRIVLGEVRGAEAYTFLRAVNTGHPGSITTIHADSPAGAIEQLALIILQSGVQLRREDIVRYILGVVDAIVHLERTGGRRRVTRIALTAAD
jgi:type IV secretion system protein VirB11